MRTTAVARLAIALGVGSSTLGPCGHLARNAANVHHLRGPPWGITHRADQPGAIILAICGMSTIKPMVPGDDSEHRHGGRDFGPDSSTSPCAQSRQLLLHQACVNF